MNDSTPRGDRPLRARPLSIWERLDFTPFELRCAAFGAVVIGLGWSNSASTTAGSFGMFPIGGLIGGMIGLRVADQYLDAGRLFRLTMQVAAVVGFAFAVVVLADWVFGTDVAKRRADS